MQEEIIVNSSKELMSLAKTMAADARILFIIVDGAKNEIERLRLIKQAVELLNDAAKIRRQAIEIQLEDIRQTQKRIDSRLPDHLRLF